MTKIAIIGGGVVGTTCAFYLSKAGYDVSLFDENAYQGTKAAVGIICPWVNQRRNKTWYRLVKEGAKFYEKLLIDLERHDFYQQSGTVIINNKHHDKLLKIAENRLIDAPEMGEVKEVFKKSFNPYSLDIKWEKGILVTGGAQVNGEKMVKELLKKGQDQGLKFHSKRVTIEKIDNKFLVDDQRFDKLVLASGPWLSQNLNMIGNYQVDLVVQQGCLIEYENEGDQDVPVIMPDGEYDYLFSNEQSLVVGATHDDMEAFNTEAVSSSVKKMIETAERFIPELKDKEIINTKLGFRAQSPSNTPFYGQLSDDQNIYLASGLGSSGLTTGPYIAYRLSEMIQGRRSDEDKQYTPDSYIKQTCYND